MKFSTDGTNHDGDEEVVVLLEVAKVVYGGFTLACFFLTLRTESKDGANQDGARGFENISDGGG